MFCPSCGFRQVRQDSTFCSGCGLKFSALRNAQADVRDFPQNYSHNFEHLFVSVRKKGLKVGGKMILAGLILVPLFGILSEIFRINPALAGLTALITFWGGILRITYALIFEGNETETLEQKLHKIYTKHIKRQKMPEALPPKNVSFSNISNGRHGMWRESSDSRFRNGDS